MQPLKNQSALKYVTSQVMETMDSIDTEFDPIARQYIPSSEENKILPDETTDPIGDDIHSPINGLVHRYPDRVLLKITDTCAVYCRFCFRKDMVDQGKGVLTESNIEQIIAYIQNAPQVREVIFSGGDPLTLSNRRLKSILSKLASIEHLDVIRFHTRAPVVSPERFDNELINILTSLPQAVYMVIHTNHANEINDAVKNTLKKLSNTSIQMLSQSVLLKGVNDDVTTLENLFRTLIRNNVKPYYLHHLDKARGTSHFRVSINRGKKIFSALQDRLSGIAMPRYVMEIPDGHGKMPVNDTYFTQHEDHWEVKDFKGKTHIYQESVKS